MKESAPCTDCNNYYPYYVMDFDHVIGEKYFGIANHSGKSLNDLKEAFDKDYISGFGKTILVWDK